MAVPPPLALGKVNGPTNGDLVAEPSFTDATPRFPGGDAHIPRDPYAEGQTVDTGESNVFIPSDSDEDGVHFVDEAEEWKPENIKGPQVPIMGATIDPRNVGVEEEDAVNSRKNEPFAEEEIDPARPDDANYEWAQQAVKLREEKQKEREAMLLAIGADVDAGEEADRVLKLKTLRRQRMMAHQIPISFFIKTVDERLRSRRLHNEVIFYLPFLVMFMFFIFIGRDTEQSYWSGAQLAGQCRDDELPPLEDAFDGGLPAGKVQQHHVKKSYRDVKTPEDWHVWFQNVVLQFYFNGGRSGSAKARVIQNNFVEGGNIKVGALRVRVLRVQNKSCDWNSAFMDVNAYADRPCHEELKFTYDRNFDETEYAIGNGSVKLPFVDCKFNGRLMEGSLGVYPCSGNVFDIPFQLSQEEALAEAAKLRGETNGGLDIFQATTRLVVVEIIVYHPAFDAWSTIKSMTEVSVGGKFLNQARNEAFEMWSNGMKGRTGYFIFFYLFVFAYIFKLIYDIVIACREGRALAFFFDLWNILEGANLLCFCSVFILRCMWWEASQELNFTLPGGSEYRQEVDYIAWLFELQLYLNSFNVIVCFLKVLKFVELDPRLNIVTRTLGAAQYNLVGVLFIFVLIVFSYALTGTLLFSNSIEGFRDVEYSFSTLMRILIGDFDYDAMREENRFLAGLFFWSYNLLGLFLMLNFIIGVISASFNDELGKTKVEPLSETIERLISEGWAKIKNIFTPNPDKQTTSREAFAEAQRTRFAEAGRLSLVHKTVYAYRLAIPSELTREELEILDPSQRDELLPNPTINRTNLDEIFAAIHGEELECQIEFLGGSYLDNVWLEVHRAYELAPLDEEIAEVEELRAHIQDSTEASLRWVLGMSDGGNEDRRPDANVAKIQELFAPTAMTASRITDMNDRLTSTERALAELFTAMVAIDAKVSEMI